MIRVYFKRDDGQTCVVEQAKMVTSGEQEGMFRVFFACCPPQYVSVEDFDKRVSVRFIDE